MNTPLVSICVPCYNAERTISETLTSLLRQTYKNLEIIVFDNHSTDKSREIISTFIERDERISLISHETNIGGEANFTLCMNGGRGKYTAVFHSDDIYHEEIISEAISVLERDTTLSAVATHAYRIGFNGEVLGERFLPYECRKKVTQLSFEELLKLTLKYGNFITCPSVIARTDLYKERLKIWNGSVFNTSADLDVWLRLSKESPMAFLSRPLIYYREAEDSYSYRIKKARTTRHDKFLAIDHHLKQSGLRELYHDDYEFQEMKDRALRTLNFLRKGEGKGESAASVSYNPWKLLYLKKALSSPFHLKFFLAAISIWTMKTIRSFL